MAKGHKSPNALVAFFGGLLEQSQSLCRLLFNASVWEQPQGGEVPVSVTTVTVRLRKVNFEDLDTAFFELTLKVGAERGNEINFFMLTRGM
ncbi:hypothetical protein D3C86_1768600 [compost metagenome]